MQAKCGLLLSQCVNGDVHLFVYLAEDISVLQEKSPDLKRVKRKEEVCPLAQSVLSFHLLESFSLVMLC